MHQLGDFWEFDLMSEQWTQIEQKGDVPVRRRGHSLTAHNQKLFLFGGIVDVTKERDELFEFDIATSTWTLVGNNPPLVEICSPKFKKQKTKLCKQMSIQTRGDDETFSNNENEIFLLETT